MFSPTSIANFLACQHLTALNRSADSRQIKRPYFADPLLDFLIKLGQAHEQAYLTQLTEQGLTIVEVPTEGSRRDAAARTIEAIRGGADVIYQASFLSDAVANVPATDLSHRDGNDQVATAPGTDPEPEWYGRADF